VPVRIFKDVVKDVVAEVIEGGEIPTSIASVPGVIDPKRERKPQ